MIIKKQLLQIEKHTIQIKSKVVRDGQNDNSLSLCLRDEDFLEFYRGISNSEK